MTVHVLRTIPLSKESRNSWREAGVKLIPRSISVSDSKLSKYFLACNNGDVIVNLGRSDNHLDTILQPVANDIMVYNHPSSVRTIKTPAAIRKTLPDFLPPYPKQGEDFWEKGPGQGGNNKIFGQFLDPKPGFVAKVWPSFDLQKHIEGTEYRIISVGHKIVQAHKKEKNGDYFDYSWVGVGGINGFGIIPLVHKAAEKVPAGDRTVIGWDIIHDGSQPYIIEANSSPGVNVATAARIVKELTYDNQNAIG